MAKRFLIGGAALNKLGSARATKDKDYLSFVENSKEAFITDAEPGVDIINANGLKFFKEVYDYQLSVCDTAEIACPQVLLELKAFAFAQHCRNFYFQKADDCEYDIKFLVRNYNVKQLKIAQKYLSAGELHEINKVINSVKK